MSPVSGLLEVSIHQGEWKLCSHNAIYSFGKRYTSFRIAFEKLGMQNTEIPEVLILGAGIGSVATLLEKNFSIRRMTVVDIDPVIIALAKKYWPYQDNLTVNFHTTDAAEWVNMGAEHTFDLILADVFIDDETPEALRKTQFLQNLHKLLKPGGLLLFSKLQFNEKDFPENQTFSRTFSETFPSSYSIPAGFNLILAGRK